MLGMTGGQTALVIIIGIYVTGATVSNVVRSLARRPKPSAIEEDDSGGISD